MKKLTSRQLIDKIASNNKTIFQAERLAEKLSDFAFENDNEHLEKACKELDEIADINRRENNRLLSDLNDLVRKENRIILSHKKQPLTI